MKNIVTNLTDINLSKFTPDYEYWFNKKDITEDEACLVVQGIRPSDYESYVCSEDILRNMVSCFDDRILAKDNSFNLYLQSVAKETVFLIVDNNGIKSSGKKYVFKDLTKEIKKENIWNGDLYSFYKELYERNFDCFADSFLSYLESKNKKLVTFDHYRDTKQYFADYPSWIKKDNLNNITKEDAAYLFIGLNPKFAKRYVSISSPHEISNYYEVDWSNEDRFFYKEYTGIVAIQNIYHINNITQEYDYKDFFSFINELYNDGLDPCDELKDYLRTIDETLKYDKNSLVYKVYSSYAKMDSWSLKDCRCLISGIHPRTNEKLITFFNDKDVNHTKINLNSKQSDYWGYFRDKSSTPHLEKDFLSKYNIKTENGYIPHKLLEIILREIEVEAPDILIDVTFNDLPPSKKETGKPGKTGNFDEVEIPAWRLISDKAGVTYKEIEFPSNELIPNKRIAYAKQFKDGWNKLSKEKQKEFSKNKIKTWLSCFFRQKEQKTMTDKKIYAQFITIIFQN